MAEQQKSNLVRPFTFYFSASKGQNKENWDDMIKKIGTFDTVEDFWGYYQHMARAEQVPDGSQYYLFAEDIKPAWDHEANHNGGRFVLRIKKKYASKFWEDMVLGLIGGQCVEMQYLNGINLHVKGEFVIIFLWIKDFKSDQEKHNNIKRWIIDIIGLNENTDIEYREHPKQQQQQPKQDNNKEEQKQQETK